RRRGRSRPRCRCGRRGIPSGGTGRPPWPWPASPPRPSTRRRRLRRLVRLWHRRQRPQHRSPQQRQR
ncbi:unnamed protein product, partial [Ectocarpus sp. 4 AP-2014]